MYRPSCPVMPVMSARFMSGRLRGKPPRLAALRAPLRVELVEELCAPLLLVVLADRAGGGAQPVERPEEALICRGPPPHVARAPPTGLAEPVQAPVVADPEARVRLDVAAGELPEAGPRTAGPGPARHPDPQPGSPQPTMLVRVRHAVTEQAGPMLTGRAPGVDLSEDGRKQAAALADRLADLPVAAVYASPIERTAQTGAAVAERHDVEVHALPGALEADYGEWTGGQLAHPAQTDLWQTGPHAPSRAR